MSQALVHLLPAILASASSAVVLADARPAAWLALAPYAVVLADARPAALLLLILLSCRNRLMNRSRSTPAPLLPALAQFSPQIPILSRLTGQRRLLLTSSPLALAFSAIINATTNCTTLPPTPDHTLPPTLPSLQIYLQL